MKNTDEQLDENWLEGLQTDPLPALLYRYRRIDGPFWLENLRDPILNNTTYLAAPNTLDDQEEGFIQLDAEGNAAEILEYLRGVYSRKHSWNEACRLADEQMKQRGVEGARQHVQQFGQAHYREQARTLIGVLSLSPTATDQRMWDEYASEGAGVCFEFDTSVDCPLFTLVYNVRYPHQRPTVNLLQATTRDVVESIALIKDRTQWGWQREWRVVRPIGPGNYEFNPRALTRVIFGPAVSDEHRDMIMQWIKGRTRPLALADARFRNDGSIIIGDWSANPETMPEALAAADQLRQSFGRTFSDSTELIREDRER